MQAVEGSQLRKLTVSLHNNQSREILHRALMSNFDKAGRQTRVSMKAGVNRPTLAKSDTLAQIGATSLPTTWDLQPAAAAPAAAAKAPYRNR